MWTETTDAKSGQVTIPPFPELCEDPKKLRLIHVPEDPKKTRKEKKHQPRNIKAQCP
jgi:hypothetical protein